MTPNWFLNLTSPILNIPVTQFFFSVLIGKTKQSSTLKMFTCLNYAHIMLWLLHTFLVFLESINYITRARKA